MNEETGGTAARAAELRGAVARAEALLGTLPDTGDADLGALRERIAASIESARARLDSIEARARGAHETATAAFERWSRANPWAALAIGAGIGLALALAFLGRRSRPRGVDGP